MLTCSGDRPSVTTRSRSALGEAGERGEVAVQEAQPVVVVLQVQAAAHALGQLVDEAELAVVVARADAVEHARSTPRRRAACRPACRRTTSSSIPWRASTSSTSRLVGPQPPLDDVTGDAPVDPQHGVAGLHPARAAGDPGATVTTTGVAWPLQDMAVPGYRWARSVAWTASVAVERRAPARRAAGLLRGRGDGDQGAGLDGAHVRAAGLLLPRDRPQPADRRALRTPGRRVRRRHRRGAAGSADHAVRPRVGARRSSPRPRRRGSYVVDSVCPLVTKVHHEVRVRAGKGYRIVYVGHAGHEEAVGTMAVAPDSIYARRVGGRRRSARRVRRAGGAARPDHAVAPRLERRGGGRQGALPHGVDAGAQRPVLRHHQPAVGADGARAALRRDPGDRLGQLLEHPGAGEAGAPDRAVRSLPASTPPTRSRRRSSPRRSSSASPPAPRRRARWSTR